MSQIDPKETYGHQAYRNSEFGVPRSGGAQSIIGNAEILVGLLGKQPQLLLKQKLRRQEFRSLAVNR